MTGPIQYQAQFRALGCNVDIRLETEADGHAILEPMPRRFDHCEDILSRFRPRSELTRFNARAGEWVPVSETLFNNLMAAKHAARLTDGLFNPLVLPAMLRSGYDRSFDDLTVPTQQEATPLTDWQSLELRTVTQEARLPSGTAVDLGGTAKGWLAQHIGQELAAYGPGLVNIGGDIHAWGYPDGDVGWRIDLADAADPVRERTLMTVYLRDASIATSGVDHRRWQTAAGKTAHHIIDPRTGYPAETDVLSVSVIHRHAPTAEAYTKAVLLLGAQAGLNWLHTRWDAAGLVMCSDHSVIATSNFVNYIIN